MSEEVDWDSGALGAVTFVPPQPVINAVKAPIAIAGIAAGIDRVTSLTVQQVEESASPKNEVVPAMKDPIFF